MRRLTDGAPLWSEPLKRIRSLAVSDDRQRILAAAEADKGSIIRVWDAASGKRLLDQRAESKGGEAVFDRIRADTPLVLFGSVFGIPEGLPRRCRPEDLGPVVRPRGRVTAGSQRVVGLAFSRDSGRVADRPSARRAHRPGSAVRPDEPDRRRERRTRGLQQLGDLLAFGGRSIRVFETESLRVVAQVDVMRQARRVEFRSDDAVLAVDSFPDGGPRGAYTAVAVEAIGRAGRCVPGDADRRGNQAVAAAVSGFCRAVAVRGSWKARVAPLTMR